MYSFSKNSLKLIDQLDDDLQTILHEAIKIYDFKVHCAYRNEQEQNKAFYSKKSKKKFPNSKHNKIPSEAVDILPYPTLYTDIKQFYLMAGIIKAIAFHLLEDGKIEKRIRWGGDWDNDNDLKDNLFNDLAHFEVIL